MNQPSRVEARLNALQRAAFDYFLHEANPANGLIADSNRPNMPSSIAAVGLGLSAYPVGVERGWMTREQALERTLATLRFFWNSSQGSDPDATGYQGFYYHFLDMQTGKRAWQCELSTIDSALLFAGMLTCAAYFCADSALENDVRTPSTALYRRADWQWAQHGGAAVCHGWKPEDGFLPYCWQGYNEALLSGRSAKQARVGMSLALRPQSRADRAHDRELPFRLALAADAAVSVRRHGAAPGRLYGRLALNGGASTPLVKKDQENSLRFRSSQVMLYNCRI